MRTVSGYFILKKFNRIPTILAFYIENRIKTPLLVVISATFPHNLNSEGIRWFLCPDFSRILLGFLFPNAFWSFFSNPIALKPSSSDRRDISSVLDSLKACMQSFQRATPFFVSISRVMRRSSETTATVINLFSNRIFTIFDMFDFSKRSVSTSSF